MGWGEEGRGEERSGRREEGGTRLAPPRPQVAANAERLREGAGPGGGACAHGPPPCPPATAAPGPAPGPELITRDARRNPPCSADCCRRWSPGKAAPAFPLLSLGRSLPGSSEDQRRRRRGPRAPSPASASEPDGREGGARPDSCCSNAG